MTHCLQEAKVSDVIAGSNDITYRQFELLKKDFYLLFNALKSNGKDIFTSSPLSTNGHFSRLLSLHIWHRSQCTCLNYGLIDHFNLFWEWSAFQKKGQSLP